MSVYTHVSQAQLLDFLGHYQLGVLHSFQGVSEGIENSVYFIDTDSGRYVLTLFEAYRGEDLDYYLQLLDHLGQHRKVPTPLLFKDRQNNYWRTLCNKPATIAECLPGQTLSDTNQQHAQAVASHLAKLHQAMQGFPLKQTNNRGLAWMVATQQTLQAKLPTETATLLEDEINYQVAQQDLVRAAHLPRGTIHADLFRDNVLFDKDRLSGIIDFYYACQDYLAYDLAIVVNDWCSNEQGQVDEASHQSLAHHYQTHRPLSPAEHRHWRGLLRLAALRFWLSRLADHHTPRMGHRMPIKDPQRFKRILLHHRQFA